MIMVVGSKRKRGNGEKIIKNGKRINILLNK